MKTPNPRRLQSRTELEQILAALTVPQLHDVAYALGKSGDVQHGATKDEVIASLQTKVDPKQLALMAHRAEALSPYKHSFLFRFQMSGGSVPEFDSAAVSFAALTSTVGSFDLASHDITPQLAIVDREQKQIYLKLVHTVAISETEETAPNEFIRRRFRQRHTVTVQLRFRTGVASITFPGFTQGIGTPVEERLSYEHIARDCCAHLKEKHHLILEGLSIRPSIETLIDVQPPEIRVEKRDFVMETSGRKVRMKVDCLETSQDVQSVLAESFHSPTDAIKNALQQGTIFEMRVLWLQLQVHTTIRFHDFAPELLFLWKRGGASSTHLEYVIQRILEGLTDHRSAIAEAESWILSQPAGAIIQTSAIMQKFGLNLQQSLQLLSGKTVAPRLALRFRVRTARFLPSYVNAWKPGACQQL